MEQDGLIMRKVYAEVPPRVEYQLAPFGETLRPVIDALWACGKQTREADLRAYSGPLLIHHVEIFKPQSNCREQAITLIDPAVRRRHGGLQRHGSFEYIFEQSGS
jgi:hypothetical protein